MDTETTARTILIQIAGLAEAGLTPPPRAAATAATLRQIAEIGGELELTLEDCKSAYDLLGFPRGDDQPAVAARRATCREISALIPGTGYGGEQLLRRVLERVAQHFAASSDPRQAAIASTAAREAAEIAAFYDPTAAAGAQEPARDRREAERDALEFSSRRHYSED